MKDELSLKEMYLIERNLEEQIKNLNDKYLRTGNEFYEKERKALVKVTEKIREIRCLKAREERLK